MRRNDFIVDQYIESVVKEIERKEGKLDVAGYLRKEHGVEPNKALSLVYEMEDRGLAKNLGKGFMIKNKKDQ